MNNMTQEHMTRRVRQLEEEKLCAKCNPRKNSTNVARNQRNQLDNSPGGGKPLVQGTSSEVVGTTSVADDVFAGARGGELGRELCGMAEVLKDTVMNTMCSEQMT